MLSATVSIREATWTTEVATTSSELTQGLSGRASFDTGKGMLFDLGNERIVAVNAYDMLFPIDLVCISESLKVTEGRLPLLPGEDFTSTVPCRYFLEVSAGEADDAGVDVGDDVLIAGYTPTTGTTSSVIDISEMMNLMITMMIVTMMMKMMMGVMKEVK